MTVAGNGNDLRWFISEWYPAVFFPFPVMWFFIGISLSLIILYRKRFTLFERLLFFGLLIAGVTSMRHIPLWAIAAMPIAARGMEYFAADVKRQREARERIRRIAIPGIGIVVFVIGLHLWLVFEAIEVNESTNAIYILAQKRVYALSMK